MVDRGLFEAGGEYSYNYHYSSAMDKSNILSSSHEAEVRKGPWTMEEDLILINYITNHGEGVWNNIARSAGLNRTGKSCRLRWLNYLRPDVRRGNITPEEQQLIMELHARWGNRWSKIARQLPGRTDNEIKNFWRTRVQKKLKHGEPFDQVQSAILTDEASTGAASLLHHHHLHHQSICSDVGGGSHMEGQNANNNNNSSALDQPMAAACASEFSTESSDNFWTVDDFWSMPSLNGD